QGTGNIFEQIDPRPAAAPKFEEPHYNNFLERAIDTVTGSKRTEFPDAPEFLQAIGQPSKTPNAAPTGDLDFPGLRRSNITSDPAAALDIIRKSIPNVEAKQDKFGNLMLRLPGMDWSYLNKPGISGRDIDELGTQTLATLPFLGAAGAGNTIPARIASGVGFMGGGELERQMLEKAAGSEQGPNPGAVGAAALAGGVLAPGVPSAIVRGAVDLGNAAVAPIANVARSASRPEDEAARRVAAAFQEGNPAFAGASPQVAQAGAGAMLAERAGA